MARILIGVVILFKLQTAAVFLFWSEHYTSVFELHGAVGKAITFTALPNIYSYMKSATRHHIHFEL
jgi:hypothetical protein